VSIGIAGRPTHGFTAELLEAADAGLVRAKRAGGNQTAIDEVGLDRAWPGRCPGVVSLPGQSDRDRRAEAQASAERLWSGLDECWHETFRQVWEALRARSIAIGACAAMPDGTIVHARNRVADHDGPPGQAFGSQLAHAEVNVLARLAYRQPRRLVLTTTLEPCLQCSPAIGLGPVAGVRFAGADPLWLGCHDSARWRAGLHIYARHRVPGTRAHAALRYVASASL
jgi:tRNA(Arg) A34 adenosine deaminase TadA